MSLRGIIFLLFGLFIAYGAVPIGNYEPWAKAAWPIPVLGADEFGRDLLVGLSRATLYSLAKGLSIAILSIMISYAFCILVYSYVPRRFGSYLIEAISRFIESVPQYIWVMAFVISFTGILREIAFYAVFSIVYFPLISYTLFSEFVGAEQREYVRAARALGLSDRQIALSHLVPNSLPVMGAILVQVAGAAIAIDGAIAWLGFSSRTEIALGVFLLRGKEWALLHPALIVSAIASFVLLYLFLIALQAVLRSIAVRRPF